MNPNQNQTNDNDIKQYRTGRITDKPSQPHVTGPTEGFIANPVGSDNDSAEKRSPFNRSNLQAAGMQPREEFLKEQQAKQNELDEELEQMAKKKPRLVMTLIVVSALLTAISGIVLAFNLIS